MLPAMKKTALAAVCLLKSIEVAAQVTVSIPYCPTPVPEPGNGGTGSTTPGVVGQIDGSNGARYFIGFYPLPSSGPILDGQSYTYNTATGGLQRRQANSGLSLEACANFCGPEPYFAVDSGTTCTCGSKAPAGTPQLSIDVSFACPSNSAESCGGPGFAIVFGPQPATPSPTASVGRESAGASSVGGVVPATSGAVVPGASSGGSSAVQTSLPAGSSPSIGAPSSSVPPAVSSAGSGSTPALGGSSASPSATASSAVGASSVPAMSFAGATSSVPTSAPAASSGSSSGPASSPSSSPAAASSSSQPAASSAAGASSVMPSSSAAPSTPNTSSSAPAASSQAPSTTQPPTTTAKPSTTQSSSSISVSPFPNFSTYGNLATPAACPTSGPNDDSKNRVDPNSVQYGVNCGKNLVGNKLYPLHADSSDICMQFCDIVAGCGGIAYLGGDANEANETFANCQPLSNVPGYVVDNTPNLLVGVPTDGVNNATDYQTDVCETPQNPSNPDTYTDLGGNTYDLSCGTQLPTAALQIIEVSAQDSLAACLYFCSILSNCQGAQFAGPGYPTDPTVANCQAFSTYNDQQETNVANYAYGILSQ